MSSVLIEHEPTFRERLLGAYVENDTVQSAASKEACFITISPSGLW